MLRTRKLDLESEWYEEKEVADSYGLGHSLVQERIEDRQGRLDIPAVV